MSGADDFNVAAALLRLAAGVRTAQRPWHPAGAVPGRSDPYLKPGSFEEAVPSSEADDAQVAYALVNVLCGGAVLLLMLMALSVVPDCFGRVRAQFLTFLVAQILLHLALLIVQTIYITFLLVWNSAVFVDASLSACAGYLVVFCVAASASLQLFSSVQRYISVIWPGLYGRICTRQVSLLISLGSALFGINALLGHVSNDRTLNYDLGARRWLFSAHFDGRHVNAFIALACLVLGALCGVAVFRLLCRSFFTAKAADNSSLNRSICLREACTVAFYFGADLIYFLTLTYCHYRALPQARGAAGEPGNHFDGLIQTYLFGALPTINGIVNFDAIRKALCFRARLTVDGAPAGGGGAHSAPGFTRQNSSIRRKYTAIPMLAGARFSISHDHG